MGGGAGCAAGPRGEAEECPNYSTIMRTGSSPLPSAKETRVGMRHRTVFPRERTILADTGSLLNGYKWVSSAALRQVRFWPPRSNGWKSHSEEGKSKER